MSWIVKNKYIITMLFIFIISSFSDYIWLRLENQPPGWDESLHLTKSLEYYNILTNPTHDMLTNLIQVDNYYPPFYHFSTVLSYLFFGTSMDAAISINIFYFGILLFSVYGIGKYLYNKETGLLAAVFISFYPSMVGMRRFYLIEVALVATVTLSIYLLLLSNHFRNRKYSLGFGIVFAIAILTKWTAVFFIIGPLLFVIYDSIKTKPHTCLNCGKPTKKGDLCSSICKTLWKKLNYTPKFNIIIMFASAFLLASIWYIPHISEVYKTIAWGNEFWGTTEGDPEVFTLQSILFYTTALINFQISFIFFIIFLIALIVMRHQLKSNYILISWIILPYIVMTLLRNKNDRYTIASIAAIALISALWISSLNKKLKITAVSIILIIGVMQLSTLAAGINIRPNIGGISLYATDIYGTRPPMNQDWKIENALDSIIRDAQTNPRIYSRIGYIGYIGILPDIGTVNGLTYGYYSYKKKFPFNVISVPYFESLPPFEQNFNNFDYLILKSGENSGQSRKKLVADMYEYFYQHSSSYLIISNFTLPDNTELYVYRSRDIK